MLLYIIIYFNESIVKVMFIYTIICSFLVLVCTLLVRNLKIRYSITKIYGNMHIMFKKIAQRKIWCMALRTLLLKNTRFNAKETYCIIQGYIVAYKKLYK